MSDSPTPPTTDTVSAPEVPITTPPAAPAAEPAVLAPVQFWRVPGCDQEFTDPQAAQAYMLALQAHKSFDEFIKATFGELAIPHKLRKQLTPYMQGILHTAAAHPNIVWMLTTMAATPVPQPAPVKVRRRQRTKTSTETPPVAPTAASAAKPPRKRAPRTRKPAAPEGTTPAKKRGRPAAKAATSPAAAPKPRGLRSLPPPPAN